MRAGKKWDGANPLIRMMADMIQWAWFRFRPVDGWLPLGLLATAVASGVVTVVEVGWVEGDSVVPWAALLGLLLSVVLAQRPISAWFAWSLLILYGLLIVTIITAQLWPPLGALREPDLLLVTYWRQSAAIFYDRFASWVRAAVSQGRSQETIVFTFGLGLLTWLLVAYAGWSTYRDRRPLTGLSLMALAISINLYFGDVPALWGALFVGQIGLLTAVLQYISLESSWRENGVDFSEAVRTDLAAYALVISFCLLVVAFAVPGIPYTQLARAFANRPAVQAAEETFTDLFGGVAQPRGSAPSPGGVGGSGILPRAYLLGNAPELYEIEMMRAEVLVIDEAGNERPATRADLHGTHWRSLSYVTYTGEGWALSEARSEQLPPNAPITTIEAQDSVTLVQSVEWLKDRRLTRYTLGTPLQINQEATVFWRGLSDFVRLLTPEPTYEVRTVLPAVSDAALRQTAVADISPTILARYTNLPDDIPPRVEALAQDIAGDIDNPYDQARAIEQFLRQYPYSLDVPLPPDRSDPVDYFLFELQAGYCDYYASSMVVLARFVGLPARIAVGFLPQEADENGVQTIYQINGHSWAEVYFAGVGWVEFEPTAAFASPRDIETGFLPPDAPEVEETPPPIPPPQPANNRLPRRLLVVLLLVLLLIVWQLRRHQLSQRELMLKRYGRLQTRARQLGFVNAPGNTPREFSAQFSRFLQRYKTNRWLTLVVDYLIEAVDVMTEQLNRQQYSPSHRAQFDQMQAAWDRARRPLRLLRVAKFLQKRPPEDTLQS